MGNFEGFWAQEQWFQKELFSCGMKTTWGWVRGEEGLRKGRVRQKWKEGEHYKQTKWSLFLDSVEEREDPGFKRYEGRGCPGT